MKKRLTMLLIGAVTAMTVLSGCSSDSGEGSSSAEAEDEVITADVLLKATDYDVEDYVTLMDDYMNLSIELDSDYEVTDTAIQDYIESYILPYYPMYETTEKTTVESGDVVNIDFTGKIDGEEFDGGTGAGTHLEIGSGSFIDGFEDGLIGVTVGTTVDLNLTFPEEYKNNPDLAGQDVVFTVTVNAIEEGKQITYDELTDEYVAGALGSYGLTTVDDLVSDVTSQLESEYEYNKSSEVQQKVLAALTEGCTVEIPEGLLDQRVEQVMTQVETEAAAQEAEVAEYVSSYYGYDDMDEFETYVNDTLKEQLIQELILEAVVADQDASITVSDFNEFVESYVSYYSYESNEAFYEVYGGEDMVKLSFAENNMLTAIIDGVQTSAAGASEE